jgi:type II secretory pathway pseudopilin PulG
MNRDNVKQSGFTIIEITLAMSFVSALLLAIAMLVIQMGDIYTRGVVLKEVNQASRVITDELQRSISSSSPFAVDSGRYINQVGGGRLCLLGYTYVWNYGRAIDQGVTSNLNRYSGNDSNKTIRFVKVPDQNASYCEDPSSNIAYEGAIEILNPSEYSLVLHKLSIESGSSAVDALSGQRMYRVSFVLGTNNQGSITFSGQSGDATCSPPADSDDSYCAINQFAITIRSGNTVR